MVRCFTATSKPRTAIYAGSFDPPSSGHLDIIERSLKICDKLIVGIGINPMKRPVFTFEERKSLLERISTEDIQKKIEVCQIEGMLADFIIDKQIDFQIRGIRSYADFDSEFSMGLINRELCDRETVFLLGRPN